MNDQASHFTPDVEALRSLPVEQAVARLLDHASELHASDLYLGLDRNDTGIAMRHQGIVQPLCRVSRDEGIRWIGHVRAMAGMPFAQKQLPSDGRWICALRPGKTIDLRINTIPTLWGEDMTLRLLECNVGLGAAHATGLSGAGARTTPRTAEQQQRPAVGDGAHGAGKTTTLYACLNYLNDGHRKINTIEDPIEYEMPGVRQSQVRPEYNFDFPICSAASCGRPRMSSWWAKFAMP